MRIYLTNVMFDDQAKALEFYRDKLGFKVKHDIPMGENRWLSLVSGEQPNGTELFLEPSVHPAAGPFKSALVADGIPFVSFQIDELDSEYTRLCESGVEFKRYPLLPWDIGLRDGYCSLELLNFFFGSNTKSSWSWRRALAFLTFIPAAMLADSP